MATMKQRYYDEFGHNPVTSLSPEDSMFVLGDFLKVTGDELNGSITRKVTYNAAYEEFWNREVPDAKDGQTDTDNIVHMEPASEGNT